MNLAFPENFDLPRHGQRSIKLAHVLTLVYAFGGVAALTALLSKFVVSPLHDELTYERRVFADESRERLIHLNNSLSHIVSSTEVKTVPESPYCERAVPANESQIVPPKAPEVTKASEMIAELSKLRQDAINMDPNQEVATATAALTSQADMLTTYARRIQFDNVPTSLFGFNDATVASGEPGKASGVIGAAIIRCEKEIRSFKSTLLT